MSVVIATFERRSLVQECIQSVIEQTFPAFEIIVVDDGSSDGSADVVAVRFPEVVIVRQQNLGRSVARNAGVARATGDWIAFLDDDDLWHREKLAVTATYLAEHGDCEALNNPIWFFGFSDRKMAFVPDLQASNLDECYASISETDSANGWDYLKIRGESFSRLLELNRGVMSASVVRRDTLIRAGGFSPMHGYSDDWAMFVNVARLTEWHTIPRRLGFSRVHAGQSSSASRATPFFIMAGLVNTWWGGRPTKDPVTGLDFEPILARYGRHYRQWIASARWDAVRSHSLHNWILASAFGRLLLPRWTDRIYSMVPPPLMWRIERYLFGKNG